MTDWKENPESRWNTRLDGICAAQQHSPSYRPARTKVATRFRSQTLSIYCWGWLGHVWLRFRRQTQRSKECAGRFCELLSPSVVDRPLVRCCYSRRFQSKVRSKPALSAVLVALRTRWESEATALLPRTPGTSGRNKAQVMPRGMDVQYAWLPRAVSGRPSTRPAAPQRPLTGQCPCIRRAPHSRPINDLTGPQRID